MNKDTVVSQSIQDSFFIRQHVVGYNSNFGDK